jgi:cyclic pyranopterin phosphate synthase
VDNNIKVKINTVVMDGKNIDDIIPLVNLTRQYPVSVRFIEEMPFNGEGSHYAKLNWSYKTILDHIKNEFAALTKQVDGPNSTASHFQVPGFIGNVGIIAAFSRTFCGTCNRIRVTAQGTLKTCLYDQGVLDIKSLLRNGADDEVISQHLLTAFKSRPKDGFEAEKNRKLVVTESMSTIGG